LSSAAAAIAPEKTKKKEAKTIGKMVKSFTVGDFSLSWRLGK
jgi:hypothetical protein